MPRSPAFAGIILAAGASSRMGQDKALLIHAGSTYLAGSIRVLQSICDFVLVVTGDNTKLIEPAIYENSAYVVRNPQPQLGQFSSLRIGLHAVLDRGRDTACVALVDRPPAASQTLATLQKAFLHSSPERTWAVVPQFQDRHGHPVIFSREMIEVFLRAPDAGNAREIEHQHREKIEYVPVDDPAVALNVNTPEDYAALQIRK